MRPHRLAGFVLTAGLAASASADRPPPPGEAERSEIFGKAHIARHLGPPSPPPPIGPRRGAAAEPDRGFDVAHYDLAIEIGPTEISGTVTIDADATIDDLTHVTLDLSDTFVLDRLESETHGVAGSLRTTAFLIVELETPVGIGERVRIVVGYRGVPPSLGGPVSTDPFVRSTHGDAGEGTLAPVIFTLSVPWRSGAWWATKETLEDKATIDLHVTVADSLLVATNGVLESVESLGDGRSTHHWSHGHEVSPYLVSLAVSDYDLLTDVATIAGAGGPIDVPLTYYVYPDRAQAMIGDTERMPEALRFLSERFGCYPFADEKLGYAMVPWPGGMEHQTIVTIGGRFVRGDKFYEWIFVHELAHHWWGNHITLADWREVWLNEGFATYTEALWVEHHAGRDAYELYMNVLDPFPPPTGGGFFGTIYDPRPLYGLTPYQKGAWVLHMLRDVLGDETFFAVLEEYALRLSGGRTSTDAFRAVAEELSGEDLATFFDQWIHVPGRPSYRVKWSYSRDGTGYDVVVEVAQTQLQHAVYEMPLEISIRTTGGEIRERVANGARLESWVFHVDAEPEDVILDPDARVLRNVPIPRGTRAAGIPLVVATPAREIARVRFVLTDEGRVSLRVFDALGRRVRTLVDGVRPASGYEIAWDGTDDHGKRLGSGVYFVALDSRSGRRRARIVLTR